MNFLVMAMIALLITQSAVMIYDVNTSTQAARTDARVDVEVANHRIFVYVAERFVSLQPFVGNTVTSVAWSQLISPVSGMETMHFQRYAIPANWLVMGNSQQWVVCTPLSPQARLKLASTFEVTPSISGSNRLPTLYIPHPWCMGDASPTPPDPDPEDQFDLVIPDLRERYANTTERIAPQGFFDH